jgi:thioredoxin-dependent peroxiredoxin
MKAPPFSLPDQNNQVVTLDQFKGKKVVLYFYPKADTPGCTVQACGLRDNIKVLKELGATVVGVSPDDQSDLKNFEKKYNLNYTLLGDPSHRMLEQYGVWKEKTFMGRRFMGVERTTVLIDEQGNIVKRYDNVNPVTHSAMIIQDIKAGVQAPTLPKSATTPIQRPKAKKAVKKKAAKAPAKKKAAKKTAKKAPAKKKAAKKKK